MGDHCLSPLGGQHWHPQVQTQATQTFASTELGIVGSASRNARQLPVSRFPYTLGLFSRPAWFLRTTVSMLSPLSRPTTRTHQAIGIKTPPRSSASTHQVDIIWGGPSWAVRDLWAHVDATSSSLSSALRRVHHPQPSITTAFELKASRSTLGNLTPNSESNSATITVLNTDVETLYS